MEYGKEIDKAQFDKWIKALRSGEYKQTIQALQDKNGYCCLGVACKILIKTPDMHEDSLIGDFPYQQKHAPEWLKCINSNFEFKTGINLTDLNDIEHFTFDEIADLLEAVYIHQVLK